MLKKLILLSFVLSLAGFAHAKDMMSIAVGDPLGKANDVLKECRVPHGSQQQLQLLPPPDANLLFADLGDGMTLVIVYEKTDNKIRDLFVVKHISNPQSRADRVSLRPEALLFDGEHIFLKFRQTSFGEGSSDENAAEPQNPFQSP